MSKVIDLDQRRKKDTSDGDGEDYIIVCECGCAMFRIYTSGDVMCLNCEGHIDGLTVHPDLNEK